MAADHTDMRPHSAHTTVSPESLSRRRAQQPIRSTCTTQKPGLSCLRRPRRGQLLDWSKDAAEESDLQARCIDSIEYT